MARSNLQKEQAEKKRQEDASIAAALKASAKKSRKGGGILHPAGRLCPRLDFRDLKGTPHKVFTRLMAYRSKWIRPIEDWQPKGKSERSILNSLINHLLARYRMPAFMMEVWYSRSAPVERQQNTDRSWIERDLRSLKKAANRNWAFLPLRFFIHVAQGGSIKAFVEIDISWTPVVTKKMQHELMNAPNNLTFVQAVRRAQVLRLGGSRQLTHTILSSEFSHEFSSLGREQFIYEVIQWLCLYPMLDNNQINPLIDYIDHLRVEANEQDRKFKIIGRSPLKLLEEMERWHGDLARIRRAKGTIFKPSEFKEHSWRMKTKNGIVVWSVKEILTSKELVREGRAMKHCVASYARSIEAGTISIWSISTCGEFEVDETRRVTVSVRNQTRTVQEARGKCNAKLTGSEQRALQKWATFAELSASSWLR